MAFSSDRKYGSAMADINVTPLVDVVLVLLIIFMVTAPLMNRGVDVDLPRTAMETAENEERLIIAIDKDAKIFIGEVEIPIEDLSEQVEKHLVLMKKKTAVFVKGDRDLRYEVVMQVMDEVKKSGVPTVGLVTQPLEKKSK